MLYIIKYALYLPIMKLTEIAELAIRRDPTVRKFIMAHYSISRQTLYNWIGCGDERLQDEKVIRFIAQELKTDPTTLLRD